MAGGYSGATRTLINTVFKAVPSLINRITSQAAATQLDPDDIKNAPRMLTPVLERGDVTLANGFTPANLRPGDIVTCIDTDAGSPDCALLIRRADNAGWISLTFDFGGTPEVAVDNDNDA